MSTSDRAVRRLDTLVPVCLAVLLPACATGQMTLTAEGRPAAVIVLANDPGEVAREAAGVLERHLQQMSGARLEIVSSSQFAKSNKSERSAVFVGMSRFVRNAKVEIEQDRDGNDHYVLRKVGDRLYLAGNDAGQHRGTAYAVYELLQRLGCGWYGPDKLWQVVPTRKTITVGPLDVDERPAFVMRHIWLAGEGGGHELLDAWRLGGRSIAHGHAMEHLVPKEKYGESNPEFYAFSRGQPCFTHAGVVRIIADKCRERLNARPDGIETFSLCASDNAGVCLCDRCLAVGNSGARNLYLVNAVASDLARTHPDRFLLTFYAYWATHDPPDAPIEAEPGVVVMQVNEGNHLKAWDEPEEPDPVATNGKTNAREVRNFRAWQRTGARMAIYDYFIPGVMDHTWRYFHWIAGETNLRNLRYWKEQGVRYLSFESQARYELKEEGGYPIRWVLFHICARGMWDPYLTSAAIMREACAKLYGAAADPMYEFYRTFEEAASRSTARGVNWNLPSPHELYTPEVEADATRYLAAAAAAATSDLSRARVAEEQRMWDRARSVLVRLRAGNVEDTFPVLLDGRPRNYSRPKIAISTLRWLHGPLRDTPVFVIDPDGQKRPPQDNEVFVLATGVQFTTK